MLIDILSKSMVKNERLALQEDRWCAQSYRLYTTYQWRGP